MSEKQCFTPEGKSKDSYGMGLFNLTRDPYPHPEKFQEQGRTYVRITKKKLAELREEQKNDECENLTPEFPGGFSVEHDHGDYTHYEDGEERKYRDPESDDYSYAKYQEDHPEGWMEKHRPEAINIRLEELHKQGYEAVSKTTSDNGSSKGNKTIHRFGEVIHKARLDPDKNLYENGEGLDQISDKWNEFFGDTPERSVFYSLPEISGSIFDKNKILGETLIIREEEGKKSIELLHTSPNYPKFKDIEPGTKITINNSTVSLGNVEYPLYESKVLAQAIQANERNLLGTKKYPTVSIGYDIEYKNIATGEGFKGVVEHNRKAGDYRIAKISSIFNEDKTYPIGGHVRQFNELNLDPFIGEASHADFRSNAHKPIMIDIGDDSEDTLRLLHSVGNQFDNDLS